MVDPTVALERPHSLVEARLQRCGIRRVLPGQPRLDHRLPPQLAVCRDGGEGRPTTSGQTNVRLSSSSISSMGAGGGGKPIHHKGNMSLHDLEACWGDIGREVRD